MKTWWLAGALVMAALSAGGIARAQEPEGPEKAVGSPSGWQAAAELALTEIAQGRPATASAWYWIATDESDYSEAYLAWQEQALARIFERRSAVTLEFSEPPKTIHVDDIAVPREGAGRPLALEVGRHTIAASTDRGETFRGSVEIFPDDVGERSFFKVAFRPRGYVDPAHAGPATAPRPRIEGGMSAFQIVTVVGTVALASGIAIGGGYLLFGSENPRGIDTPEGAAIIGVELLLIGGGTAIALLSD